MREIKIIGQKKFGKRNYLFGLYECPECNNLVEKIAKDGRNANYCSHSCYARNRSIRGAYKEFVIISGYKYLRTPDHPNCTKNGYVAEHRLVSEKKIGRYLNQNEDVHHINENKLDNNPKNLMILTKSEHQKLHKIKNYQPCEITE